MPLNKELLIKAVKDKNFIEMRSLLKPAVRPAIQLACDAAKEDVVILENNRNTDREILDSAIDSDGCSIATRIANFYIDSTIEEQQKIQLDHVVLYMLIIGCNYSQKNPKDDKSVLDYMCNRPLWKNIIKQISSPDFNVANNLCPYLPVVEYEAATQNTTEEEIRRQDEKKNQWPFKRQSNFSFDWARYDTNNRSNVSNNPPSDPSNSSSGYRRGS